MGEEMQYQPYKSYLSSLTATFNFNDLLAHHQAFFGNARMENEGGDGGAGGGGEGGAPTPNDMPGANGGKPDDLGFPADTAVKDMTVDQQAAYWKAQAQKHEKAYKGKFGDLTPDQLAALVEKADAHDALERELMSDKDKAILEARESAIAEANSKNADRLVKAEFKAATAGRLDADRLKAMLEPLDLKKFLDKSGDVDEAKVAAFVDAVAPKAGAGTPQQKGPSSNGLGQQSHTPGERGSQGRAMAERRFGKTPA